MEPFKILPDNFEDFYKNFYTPIWKYVFLRVGRREEADDLTQTIFIKTYELVLKEKNGKQISPAYLYSAARNAIIDTYKKNKEISVNFLEIEWESVFSYVEEGSFDKEQQLKAIKLALKNLSEKEKQVIELKYIEDFSNEEIAKILNEKESNIRQLQSRGIKKLKECLKK